jgi:uncharacterized protein
VQQAKQLSIATGGTGGICDPLAGGFGTIIAKELPGITATAEVTGGSLADMKLVGSGNSRGVHTDRHRACRRQG